MKDKERNYEEIEVSHTLDQKKVVSRGQRSGEGVDATLLSDTLRYINLTQVDMWPVALLYDAPLFRS